MKNTDTVDVCSYCLRASCWQGVFHCDRYRSAAVSTAMVGNLRILGLEHEQYWSKQKPAKYPWIARLSGDQPRNVVDLS